MSTFGPTNTINLLTNDADFQAWVTAVHNAIAALGGVVQTADTGQINPATVTRPGTNTSAGYEIWRFNDALQAIAPFFIKLEYGIGGTATHPSMWLTVGTGTDGAGTLTGNVSTRTQIGSGTPTGSEQLALTGDAGRLSIFHRRSVTGGVFLHVERPRDENGAVVSDGCIVALWTTSPGVGYQFVPSPSRTGISVPAVQTSAPCVSFTGGTSNDGTNVAVSQHHVFFGKQRFLNIVTVNASDLTSLSTASVSVLGVTRTYLPLGIAGSGWNSGASSGKPAILFE